jgi:hypothetical protein
MAISGIAWGCFSLLARGADDPVETNASNLIGCLLPAAVVSSLAARWVGSTGNGKNPTFNGRRQPLCGGTSRMMRDIESCQDVPRCVDRLIAAGYAVVRISSGPM